MENSDYNMYYMPYKIEDPEFVCSPPFEYALEATIQISSPVSGEKWDRHSLLAFQTNNTGGYPMSLAVRINGEWHEVDEADAINIRFRGGYEANILKDFFRHTGRMVTVMYGQPRDE